LFIEHFPLPSILTPFFEHTLRRILSAKNLDLPTSVPVPGFKISKHDRWIIYKAIITLAVDLSQPLPTIRTLYSAYLAGTTELKGSPRVFAAFIRAFAYCGSLDEAALVPHDMRTKGLEPNVRQDVVLAWAYARVGEVDKAMALLIKIERDVRDDGRSRLVMPQLAVYGWVIEGFVQAGLYAQARGVEERMKRRISYRSGLNRRLDEVLNRLRSDSVD
jgi:pentatricopeptide repeat protein